MANDVASLATYDVASLAIFMMLQVWPCRARAGLWYTWKVGLVQCGVGSS